jgi:uncharacterized protein
MLIVLSPAKSLDFEAPPHVDWATEPRFLSSSQQLITRLRRLKPAALSELMDISPKLAELNVARYAQWLPDSAQAKPAVLAFDGDVYDGLQARELNQAALEYAQKHVRILSGLYGVLRPMDNIMPHRLEMGTQLKVGRKNNLVQYWKQQLVPILKADLQQAKAAALVNLASEEYFSAVDWAALGLPVVQPVFEELRGDQYKVISFNAKRARGKMARFAIDHAVTDPQGLKNFAEDGYCLYEAHNPAPGFERWVFRRG